jgi:hypothetical protein
MNKILSNSIKVYILIIISVIIFKPDFIYDKKHNKFKSFGVNKNKTLLSLPIFSILIAVLIYIFFSWIEKINIIQYQYNNLIQQQLLNNK